MRHTRACAWVVSWCVLICMHVHSFFFFYHTPMCSLYNLSLCVPLFLCLCACVCTCAGARGCAVPQWLRPVRVEGRVLVHLHYQHGGRPASLRGGGPKPQDQVSERVSAGRLQAWHCNAIWEEKTGNCHWYTHWSWHWHRKAENKQWTHTTAHYWVLFDILFYFMWCSKKILRQTVVCWLFTRTDEMAVVLIFPKQQNRTLIWSHGLSMWMWIGFLITKRLRKSVLRQTSIH